MLLCWKDNVWWGNLATPPARDTLARIRMASTGARVVPKTNRPSLLRCNVAAHPRHVYLACVLAALH
jgi:hypothetical protein